MTRPFDKHLDSDELDGLASLHARSVSGPERLAEQALEEARRHVESCQDCAGKVRAHSLVQGEISRLGGPRMASPTPDCLTDAEWLKVAAGLLPEKDTRKRMLHAAQCDHCGPLLREAAETLSDEATSREEELLASLGSARPDWQRDMAESLRRGTPGRQRPKQRPKQSASWWQGLFAWPRPAFAVAGLAAVIMAGWLGVRMLHPPSAEQLLAQAYTERRTLEVRIPGAKYAPMRVERGSAGSNLDRPPALLKAEALIGENLKKTPNDPAWLEAKARADLLDGNYESSIKSLQRALEAQPDSPALLTDLGSAYFLRAESADRPIDYGNAIESLGKALAKSPDDPVALFNRALACERMYLYTQAVDDWEHYLRVDPQGEWAEDARKRLAALKEKLKQHEKRANEPLLGPKQFAEVMAGSDEGAKDAIDQRIEDYLYKALAEWLTLAYPASSQTAVSQDQRDARTALATLAELLSDKHHDRWMADFLEIPLDSHGEAVDALAKAVVANQSVNPTVAQPRANQAEQRFHAIGNSAGVMRARFEEIYALHWLQKSSLCAAKTLALIPELRERKYLWLLIQVQLERFVCTNALEDPGAAEAALKLALPIAQQADYGAVYLRGVGFTAFLETENGNRRTAWSLNREGLTKYWGGLYPPFRVNQFYSDLCSDAEAQANWQLALPLAREALKFAIDDGDVSFEAISRYRLAEDALMAGATDEGESEFAHAGQLFDGMPQDSTTRIYRAYSQLWSAKRELRNGELDKLRERMTVLGATLPKISSDVIAMDFYRTWGELDRREGNTSEAAWALVKAVQIAEKRLQSLTNERQRFVWNREAGNIYRSLVETRLKVGEVEEALELWEWYRGSAVRNARHSSTPALNGKGVSLAARSESALPTIGNVRRSLSYLSSDTVISYAQLADGLAIWVYDNRGVVERWVTVSKEDLGQLAQHLRELCADPNSDPSALRETARRLHELLIAPIEDHLEHSRVLIVEPDTLGEVPFRVLLDSSGRYLGDVYQVVISPGLLYRQDLGPSSLIAASDRALIVGAPAYGEEGTMPTGPLPDASSEATALAARFPQSTLLSGKEATLRAVQTNLHNRNIFHFAGHAYASADGVRLLLAPSTLQGEQARVPILTADRLRKVSLRQYKLVVLSACETAQSGEAALADPENLVGAFLSAGVGNVVASRWKVDSVSTAAFMDSLYSALLSGQPVAAALKTAALDLRRQPGRWHPYYWAAFENYGGI